MLDGGKLARERNGRDGLAETSDEPIPSQTREGSHHLPPPPQRTLPGAFRKFRLELGTCSGEVYPEEDFEKELHLACCMARIGSQRHQVTLNGVTWTLHGVEVTSDGIRMALQWHGLELARIRTCRGHTALVNEARAERSDRKVNLHGVKWR